MAPLRAEKVGARHATFGDLWPGLGIEQIADVRARPGMPPTPGHLQRLLAGLQAAPPMAIVISGFHDARAGRWLAQQLGGAVPVLVLPATGGTGAAEAELAEWFDRLLRELLAAAG